MHIVKIAVELEGHLAQLIQFDQRQPLSTIIQTLCINWSITDSENYALQFCELNNKNYVTEKNRNEVKNGSVLELRSSPAKTVEKILETLQSNASVNDKVKVLENLASLSSDLTFAQEFIKENGLALVISMIEDQTKGGAVTPEMLQYVMAAFVELMEHDTVSWDILQPSFVLRIIQFTNTSASIPKEVIESALAVLENLVQSSAKAAAIIEKEVSLESLLRLLQDQSSQVVQQNAIALINALFMKADDARKRSIAVTISAKQYRSVILSNVINNQIGTEMAHQLYVLQTLTLNLLEQRMLCKMNAQDQDGHEKIKELRRIAFDDMVDGQADGTGRRQNAQYSNYYKKLGFKSDINPAQDFIEVPPGMLALDCMVYLARNYVQNYKKVVHENSCRADEHDCQFGRTSVELVKLLCEILKIGEAPSDQGLDYYPMFFTHDHPFEEFYCICIMVLNKTWKDMRATNEDFAKVFSVVREQVTRSLSSRPLNLEDFRTKIQSLTYSTITALRQQERTSKEDIESTAAAIVNLKTKITPEIIDLIKKQRLAYLVEGTRFSKYTRGTRNKDKFWYARLSPNHKVIHYGDCDEKTVPTIEELSNKVQVFDIKQLLTGKECPHMKEMRAKKSVHLGFSITFDSNMDHPNCDFVAPDEMTFNYWTDGINALLGQPMVSQQKEEDLKTLLAMEIKLRLLDTEGVDISKDPPPIPEEPDNYDFNFES